MKIDLRLDLKQPVNQWMGIALIGMMCFWVVLYYFVNKTEAFGNNYINAVVTTTSHNRTQNP